MTITDNTFPQSGDGGYAEDFASLHGQQNVSDYVEDGFEFTNIDWSGGTADVSAGKAFVSTNEASKGNGETVLTAVYAVHKPTTTIPLSSNTTNYVYLNGNVGTNDSPELNTHTDQSNAEADALFLGTINTDSETTELFNRSPDAEFDRLRSYIDLGIPVYDETDAAESGEGNIIYITGDGPDTQGLWVYTTSGWSYAGIQSLRDADVSGVTGLIEDEASDMPSADTEGRLFFASDAQAIYYDDGDSWVRLALDASQIEADDLGFDPATQPELDTHENTGDAHHPKTTTLDELSDTDVDDLIVDSANSRPSAGSSGTLFIARNTGLIQYDDGSSWRDVGVSTHSDLSNIGSDDHHRKTDSLGEIDDSDANEIIIERASNRPSGGTAARVFIASDTGTIQYDDGSGWSTVGVHSHDQLTDISSDDHHARYTDEEAHDAIGDLLSSGNNISLTYNDSDNDLIVDTSGLNEEEVEDTVSSLLRDGNAINVSYNDSNDTLTIAVDEAEIAHNNLSGISSDDHHSRYTDDEAQDAVGSITSGGDKITVTYDNSGNTLSIDTSALDKEEIEDAVDDLLTGGNAITAAYDDANSNLTLSVDEGQITHNNLSSIRSDDHHSRYTNEEVRDTVGAMANGGNAISVSFDDGGNSLSIGVDEDQISHDNLSNVSSSDHHSRYTDEEARDAVGAIASGGNAISVSYDDSDDSLSIDVNESQISHDNLSNVSSSDHHSRYSDNEAISAVNSESTLSVNISGDADTLDGTHLGNIDWGDVSMDQSDVTWNNSSMSQSDVSWSNSSMSRSDVNVSHLGTANSNLNMSEYNVRFGNVRVTFDASADTLKWADTGGGSDRMELSRGSGDLAIEGSFTEGKAL